MDKPQILWYARLENDTYHAGDEIYAGTYTKEKKLNIYIQLWNNRYGTADVEDLKNFNIVFGFEDVEDASLLAYWSVAAGNEELKTVVGDRQVVAVVPKKVVLSGRKNNGTEECADNYLNLLFSFDVKEDIKLKENDYKAIYIDLVEI